MKMGLEKVHFAEFTEGENGAIGTWGTPSAILGAVEINVEPDGESTIFYADNTAYETHAQDNGFTGTITIAEFEEKFLMAVLGWVKDKNGLLIEKSDSVQKPFALLFEIMGKYGKMRVCLYHVTGSKPKKGFKTNGKTKELEAETMSITAKTIDFDWITTAKVSLYEKENAEIFKKWFENVQLPVEPVEPLGKMAGKIPKTVE